MTLQVSAPISFRKTNQGSGAALKLPWKVETNICVKNVRTWTNHPRGPRSCSSGKRYAEGEDVVFRKVPCSGPQTLSFQQHPLSFSVTQRQGEKDVSHSLFSRKHCPTHITPATHRPGSGHGEAQPCKTTSLPKPTVQWQRERKHLPCRRVTGSKGTQ